jgi:hypothetical protein
MKILARAAKRRLADKKAGIEPRPAPKMSFYEAVLAVMEREKQ